MDASCKISKLKHKYNILDIWKCVFITFFDLKLLKFSNSKCSGKQGLNWLYWYSFLRNIYFGLIRQVHPLYINRSTNITN
jgi:hypothetical protein